MRSLPLIACLALGGSLFAQATNQIGIYPDQCGVCIGTGEVAATNLITVFAPGINADCLTKFPASHFRGIGQTRQTPGGPIQGALTGAVLTVQDENPTTQESYTVLLIADDPSNPGQPDPSAAGTLFSAPGLVPTTATSTPTAWTLTDTYATPFTGIPQDQDFYFGINFTASSTWSQPGGDGLSQWTATYYAQPGQAGVVHDNPRPNAPSLGWYIQRTSTSTGTVFEANTPFQWITSVHMLVGGPSMVVGGDVALASRPQGMQGGQLVVAPNPNFGVGGLYPDTSGRLDGTALFARDMANPNSPGALWMSAGFTPFPPISLPFTEGNVYVNPVGLIVLPAALDGNGEANFILFPQGSATINKIANLGGGPLAYQFLTLTQQFTLALPNAGVVDYK